MDYLGGMPARPPQSNGNGTPGMQQGRIPGVNPLGTPSPGLHSQQAQQQQQSMLQLSGVRRPPPHATMTPGVRVLNVQRFPGGPVNQRRILVPVSQQPQPSPQQQLQHMQQQQRQLQMLQQQPREGETPPPPPAASPPLIKQPLMQPMTLPYPTPEQSAATAARINRATMQAYQAQLAGGGTPQGRQMGPGLTPQQLQRQQQLLQQQRQSQQQQQTPRAPAAATPAGRPQQQQGAAAGTPSQQRSVGGARTHGRGGATSAARAAASQQQPPRYKPAQMAQILKSTAGALEKLRLLRQTVQSAYVGERPTSASDGLPCRIVDAAVPELSEEEEQKRVERMQTAKGVLESLYRSLNQLPNSTMPMYGGKEREMAWILDSEQMREKKGGETAGEEIERTLTGEELRIAFFSSAMEAMGKLPMARHLHGNALKEGLSAHSSFLLCLSKMQSNTRLKQQRNLKIRLLNNGPRDTRFEMCISTPHHLHPMTTVMRVVITVCDGCLARATFLGPNEIVDSSTEEQSAHLVYRQMSTNATNALLRSGKGRQMSLMSSINSIFNFLQQYPQCLQSPCSECGKCLRDFLPPTIFVSLLPPKYAHPDCFDLAGRW